MNSFIARHAVSQAGQCFRRAGGRAAGAAPCSSVLAACLFGAKPEDPVEQRRQCGRVSRRIRLLRAHGLVAKYPRSRRYRVTEGGQRFMTTAIHVRSKLFARELPVV